MVMSLAGSSQLWAAVTGTTFLPRDQLECMTPLTCAISGQETKIEDVVVAKDFSATL